MTTNTPPETCAAPSIATESGPPADEWAKETEGAIDQHTSMSSGERSNDMSASPELPGAFPLSMPEVSAPSVNITETAKHTAEVLYVSAHHKVEDVYTTAQHGVEGVYASAEHAARQYLPTSVLDKLKDAGVLREDIENKSEQSTQPLAQDPGVDKVNGDVATIGTSQTSQSTSKPSATYASPKTPPPDTPSFTPLHEEVGDPNTATRTNPRGNTFTSNQPALDTKPYQSNNPFRTTIDTAQGSPPSSSVARRGTLTSPDHDAQAAAQVTQDTTTGTDEGADTETTSRTAANTKANTNGSSKTEKDMNDNMSPPSPDNLNRMDGDDSANYRAHAREVGNNSASESAVTNGDTEGGDGGGDHTRKLSFVQKMKGEAKTLAEKIKAKARG